MVELTGWLLDVFANPVEKNLSVWFLSEDGERICLSHDFPVVCYAAGPDFRLRALWKYIKTLSFEVQLYRTERRDLFQQKLRTVMKIECLKAAEARNLFDLIEMEFPDLEFFDIDIAFLTRYAAVYDVFPLLKCKTRVSESHYIQSIEPVDRRWDLDHEPIPLRVLSLRPNCDPAHQDPTYLIASYGKNENHLALQPARALLASVRSLIKLFDPDLILTDSGDLYLLPMLMDLAEKTNDVLQLNRDTTHLIVQKESSSYWSYGGVHFKEKQIHLFGRYHIDRSNAMQYEEYGLEGIFELARITGLPVQSVARNSPGAGVTSMEVIEALRMGALIPYHKAQAESFKSAQDLIDLDQGGLIYPPIIGLHENVGAIDFSSMFAHIALLYNVSSEVTTLDKLQPKVISQLNVEQDWEKMGLVPRMLHPLLKKRMTLKYLLATLDARDCRYKPYKAQAAAEKWILVVFYGYTGFAQSIFSKIEAHQGITAFSRQVLLTAKEIAEEMGFTVLHLYIDGLWVKQEGFDKPEDFQPLIDEITRRTHIPIVLDGVFRWIVFHHSRMNEDIAVPNRYFGVFQNHEIKVRGLDLRRGDTPAFISEAQMEMIQILAKAKDIRNPKAELQEIYQLLRRKIQILREDRAPLERLLVHQKITRLVEEYKVPSPAAIAAVQLQKAGKTVKVGQEIKFLYVRGMEKVQAWDLPNAPQKQVIDIHYYSELLIRAASNVLQPFQVNEKTIREIVIGNAQTVPLPGVTERRNTSEILKRILDELTQDK